MWRALFANKDETRGEAEKPSPQMTQLGRNLVIAESSDTLLSLTHVSPAHACPVPGPERLRQPCYLDLSNSLHLQIDLQSPVSPFHLHSQPNQLFFG